jgi:hypothetical protein
MKDDIRKQTYIIIRKHGQYLQGRSSMTGELVWSWSAYDAWRTRDMKKARETARKTGGIMVLFNQVVNTKKVIGT